MKFIVAVVVFLALVFVPSGLSTGSSLLPAHSHWDDPNVNYEIKACYIPIAAASGAGSTYGWIPFREVDSQNFMQLEMTKTGLVLKRRVSGAFTVVTPSFKTTHSFALGTDIMYDLTAIGSTFTVYQLNSDGSRGPMWYQWSDSTFSKGVNISYYTQSHYYGEWESVTTTPLDSNGVGHKISALYQDARNVTGTGATFDSAIPANGGVTGISTAKNGGSPQFGLPHGANYTFKITVDKAGSGHFDFRDPATEPQGTGGYFKNSFYRLTLGSTPTIQRYNGSTAGTTYKASTSGTGGTYTLQTVGASIYLYAPSGTKILTVNDGGPQFGLRVRVLPGDQTWTWTGTAN